MGGTLFTQDRKKRGARIGAGSAAAPSGSPSGVTFLERRVLTRLLESFGAVPATLVLWNGEEITAPGRKSLFKVRLRSRRIVRRLLLNTELSFGDFYSQGLIEVEGDLVQFLDSCHRAQADAPQSRWWTLHWALAHSLSRSKENVYHHYDIGNDFYRMWLDADAMQYTCAYFPEPNMTLEQAQEAKMHHVCRKLRLRPGLSVIEAGCGWGGLARFMAKNYGVRVTAYNISREQVRFAKKRAAAEGLRDRVEYVEDDYRNIRGQCDVFVSVGMLEHVGVENYGVLGGVIDRCLSRDGRGLIHTIGRNQPGRLNEWIRRRIFPGGEPPSLGQMAAVFEPRRFSVIDVENLRLHYAKTAEHWLERFNRREAEITKLYDAAFVRAWRLYLAGTVAGFLSGTLQLFQVVFTRPEVNDLPWSRGYLHRDPAAE